MVYIGDIDIPILTEKDTSIDRDTIEKNFVDAPTQRYELIPNLESGTYTGLLHKEVHDRSESFEEQIDGVRSLPYRHVSECPIQVSNEQGYLAVDVGSISIIPSLQVRETEIDLRFLDEDTYIPAFILNAEQFSDDFSIPACDSILALPDSYSEVKVDGSTETPNTTLEGQETTFQIFVYDTEQTLEIYPDSQDISRIERLSPVRVFNSDSNRIYSGSKRIRDYEINNGFLLYDKVGTTVNVSRWDSGWQSIGSFSFEDSDSYISDSGNYETTIKTNGGDTITGIRGFPTNEVTVSGVTSFEYQIDNFDSVLTENPLQVRISTTDGYIAQFARGEDKGSLSADTTNESIVVDNLNSSEQHTFFVGVDPFSGSTAEFAFCRGDWKQTMVQR